MLKKGGHVMKKITAILLSIVMVFTMTACAGNNAPSTNGEAAATDAAEDSSGQEATLSSGNEDIQIVFSTYALLSPFFVAAAYGYMNECNNLGIKPMLMEAGNNMQRQIDQIDNAITKGADAIIIIPYDSDGLSVAVEACNNAGIPVFAIDRTITGGQTTTVLQSDNVACGRKVAEEFLVQFKERGLTDVKLIQIRGQLGSSPSRDRDQGFWEVINAQDEITVTKVAESAADWESGPAEEQTLAHLTANTDADAIFYEADCMQPGVFAAMEQLGLVLPQSDPNHIVNGGVDGSAFALEQIRAGTMDVCVSQMPLSQGIVATYLALHAEKFQGAADLPPQILFDAQGVTPANYESYGGTLWGDMPIGGSEIPDDLKAILMQ